jgi:hypothetical protein
MYVFLNVESCAVLWDIAKIKRHQLIYVIGLLVDI